MLEPGIVEGVCNGMRSRGMDGVMNAIMSMSSHL